jgi:serine O-acetyltransferase
MTLLETLRRDARRYAGLGGWLRHPGFWIVAVWRLGAWIRSLPSPLLRLPLWLVQKPLALPGRLFFNVIIHADRIGPGFCLIHPANVLIGDGVVMGEDCLVFHEVTVGSNATDLRRPRIGNRVDIYVGARVLGGLTIGDGSMIGANCVVTRNVPPASALVAPQGRVLPRSLLAAGPPAGGEEPARPEGPAASDRPGRPPAPEPGPPGPSR